MDTTENKEERRLRLQRESANRHRAKYPEKVKATHRRYYQKNKARLLARTKEWCAANIDIVRDRKLRRNFGITYSDYQKMLTAQNGMCAVGPHPLVARTPTDLHPVDHDHKTGQVRGIVCHHCNLAIGHLRDSSERARQVAAYLDKFADLR